MTDTVRYPLVLGLIAVCSAASLAFSYVLTRDEIRRQAALEKDRGLATVFGIQFDEKSQDRPWHVLPASAQKEGEGYSVFEAKDPRDARALYAAEGIAWGYRSNVEVIVAVDETVKDNYDAARIKAMKVVAQAETAAIGDKCQTLEFQRQFEGLLLGRLELKKGAPCREPGTPGSDEQGISAITGATITSNAVIAAVQQAIDRICESAAQQPGGEPPKKQ